MKKLLLAVVAFILLGSASTATAAQSASFSGSNYAQISDASQTGLDITGDHTFYACVKTPTAPTSGAQWAIMSKFAGNSNSERAYAFLYDNNSGTKQIRVHSADSSGNGGANGQVSTDLGTSWHCVLYVYDASNGTVTFYKDGSSLGSASSMPTSLANTSAPFIIGAVWVTPSSYEEGFHGYISDARLWNRKLSSTEITSIFSDACAFSNGSGLKIWSKLDGDFTDSSGNGNNLTGVGSPSFVSDVPYTCSGGGGGGGGGSSTSTAGFPNETFTPLWSGLISFTKIFTGIATGTISCYLGFFNGALSTSTCTIAPTI